jgi:ribosomal protein S18 acetylase RimI-like enzyme
MAKLQIIKLLLLASISLHAQEFPINITCDSEAQIRFADRWQALEPALALQLLPLSKKITLAQAGASLQGTIIKNPKKKGFIIKLKTENNYLDFKASFLRTKKDTAFFINSIDVHADYRNKGIGRACIEVFDNTAIAHLLGYNSMSLESLPSARGFYNKLGFTYIGGKMATYENEDDDDNLYLFAKQIHSA